MTGDDHALARDLASQAGARLLELRAQGGDPDVLRKAGDRLSHEFLTTALAGRRPGDVVLSEEGADHPGRRDARAGTTGGDAVPSTRPWAGSATAPTRTPTPRTHSATCTAQSARPGSAN